MAYGKARGFKISLISEQKFPTGILLRMGTRHGILSGYICALNFRICRFKPHSLSILNLDYLN